MSRNGDVRVGGPFPELSVVIPTKNSARSLPSLLTSIHEQRMQNVEIIVVDNYSSDQTRSVGIAGGAIVLNAGPERSAQRNLGASRAQSDRLLFLDSDMELVDPNTLNDCKRALDANDAVVLSEQAAPDADYWAHVRALERQSYFRSMIFEAARGFRKEVFFQLGGYDSSITGLEDMDMQANLLDSGARVGWVDAAVIHHENGVGFMNYLRKRILYSRTDYRFYEKHPQYWRQLTSVNLRLGFLSARLKQSLGWTELSLLPGLIFLRASEYLLRGRSQPIG